MPEQSSVMRAGEIPTRRESASAARLADPPAEVRVIGTCARNPYEVFQARLYEYQGQLYAELRRLRRAHDGTTEVLRPMGGLSVRADRLPALAQLVYALVEAARAELGGRPPYAARNTHGEV